MKRKLAAVVSVLMAATACSPNLPGSAQILVETSASAASTTLKTGPPTSISTNASPPSSSATSPQGKIRVEASATGLVLDAAATAGAVETIRARLADSSGVLVESSEPGSVIVVGPAAEENRIANAIGIRGSLTIREVLESEYIQDGGRTAPSSGSTRPAAQPESTEPAELAAWRIAAANAIAVGVGCRELFVDIGIEDVDKPLLTCERDGRAAYVLDSSIVRGDDIRTAAAVKSDVEGWQVVIGLSAPAHSLFADFTASHVGKGLGITLDGRVLIAPTIRSEISTDIQISGNFTQNEARALAQALTHGSLPAAFTISSVTPTG